MIMQLANEIRMEALDEHGRILAIPRRVHVHRIEISTFNANEEILLYRHLREIAMEFDRTEQEEFLTQNPNPNNPTTRSSNNLLPYDVPFTLTGEEQIALTARQQEVEQEEERQREIQKLLVNASLKNKNCQIKEIKELPQISANPIADIEI